MLAIVRGETVQVEGITVPVAAAAGVMLRAAHAFLDERGEHGRAAWHVRELADGRARIRARLGAPVAVSDAVLVARRPIGRTTGSSTVGSRHPHSLCQQEYTPIAFIWRRYAQPLIPICCVRTAATEKARGGWRR